MKITFRGKIVEATEVGVLTSNEHWNEYQLEDGRVLKYKEVLVAVLRIEGLVNSDGTPAYQIQTRKVVDVR